MFIKKLCKTLIAVSSITTIFFATTAINIDPTNSHLSTTLNSGPVKIQDTQNSYPTIAHPARMALGVLNPDKKTINKEDFVKHGELKKNNTITTTSSPRAVGGSSSATAFKDRVKRFPTSRFVNNEQTDSKTYNATRVWEDVTMTSKPNKKSKKVGVIKLGQKVDVLSSKRINGKEWLKVRAVVHGTRDEKEIDEYNEVVTIEDVPFVEPRTGWVAPGTVTNYRYYSDYLASEVFGLNITYITPKNPLVCGEDNMLGWEDKSAGIFLPYGCMNTEDPTRIFVSEMAKRANTEEKFKTVYFVVAHEAAHTVVLRICGDVYPPITGSRGEEVTDAYAVSVYRADADQSYYGFKKSDTVKAKTIMMGRCE